MESLLAQMDLIATPSSGSVRRDLGGGKIAIFVGNNSLSRQMIEMYNVELMHDSKVENLENRYLQKLHKSKKEKADKERKKVEKERETKLIMEHQRNKLDEETGVIGEIATLLNRIEELELICANLTNRVSSLESSVSHILNRQAKPRNKIIHNITKNNIEYHREL